MPDGAAASKFVLVCVSGPDSGKRLAIGEGRSTLGRGVACNIVSDDADVVSEHVAFTLKDGAPIYESVGGSPVFVDGQIAASGALMAGKQLRFGRSYWQLASSGGDDSITGWVDKLSSQITDAAGVERIKGFSPVEFFSQRFRQARRPHRATQSQPPAPEKASPRRAPANHLGRRENARRNFAAQAHRRSAPRPEAFPRIWIN